MRLWMIGCGNMGSAMLRRWVDSGTVAPADVFVANRTDRGLPAGVRQGRALPDEAAPDAVVLGVKPQQLREAAAVHRAQVAPAPLLVSMLAGVDPAALGRAFPGPAAVQTMPNLPVELGRGVVAVHAPGLGQAPRAATDRLLAPLGLVRWFDDPARFAAAGALSGTAPAFLFRFVDALAAGGEAIGLSPAEAAAVALASVEGAAAMAATSDRTPAALADAVASPRGMTREGLDVLDADRALFRLLEETLRAVARRGEEMAEAARSG
ncbi:pyrroline-5-carboxylate reductase family protein [Sphingomonas corticis]|jgi:pyrroline-5-carboxylate reductase|uniref:Pyrroline-5-carboxylate reductase n=1 Tax=Sphingomonas corticis TaxID=2722791 RepID=A0ABX1CUB4_9SPHN|nr:pyrroline-5-carboxylate reductase dimerization domain-containing protein [Sphingomonas corticis]NJR79885.1 NAD(P)-binding domain-containing protein [Sphingomonas corticis]